MNLMDVILSRRSVRNYVDEDIDDDVLDRILEAGLLAPTSRNRKPCEFIVVKDKDVLKQLSESKASGSGMLASCNVAIVVIADSDKADTWIEDSSIAMAYMDLMANYYGIGCCWCQSHLRFSGDGVKSEDVVRNILSSENKYRIVGIFSLGVKEFDLEPHTLSEIDKNKVKYIK